MEGYARKGVTGRDRSPMPPAYRPAHDVMSHASARSPARTHAPKPGDVASDRVPPHELRSGEVTHKRASNPGSTRDSKESVGPVMTCTRPFRSTSRRLSEAQGGATREARPLLPVWFDRSPVECDPSTAAIERDRGGRE